MVASSLASAEMATGVPDARKCPRVKNNIGSIEWQDLADLSHAYRYAIMSVIRDLLPRLFDSRREQLMPTGCVKTLRGI